MTSETSASQSSRKPNRLREAWSSLPIRLKGGVAIAIPILALLFVSLLNLAIETRQSESDRLVSSAAADRLQVHQVLKALIDAETGVRGFALTQDRIFLQPYFLAVAAYRTFDLETKQSPGSRTGANAARVLPLAGIALDGVEQIRSYVESGRSVKGKEQALNALLVEGKDRMDHLRSEIYKYDSEQSRFLQEKKSALASIRLVANAADLFAIGLAFLGTLLSAYLLDRAIIARISHAYEAARLLATGHPVPELPESRDEIGRLMTGLRQASELLIQREQALVTNNRDLLRALEGVRVASEHKSRFLANMSHELRTPLNSIIGFTEILHDKRVGDINEMQEEFLGDSLTSARHLLTLINDILDLEKIAAGRMELSPERFDLHLLIAEAVHEVSVTAAATQVRLVSEPEDNVRWVVLDRQKTKQILLNLVTNAVKFTPKGGLVTVHARSAGIERCVLEVQDTGIGISEHDQTRLFREFEQLETTASKRFQGTGLGLALTKKLVEAQGGTVAVVSRLGSGSTFSAILPTALEIATPRANNSFSNRRDETVLVVEGNENVRSKSVATALEESGCIVERISGADQALHQVRQYRYRALVTDLLLSGKSGLDLVHEVRLQEHSSDLPIIIVTGDPGEAAPQGFVVSDALTLASSPAELVATLNKIRKTGEGHYVLIVDDDPHVHKLAKMALRDSGLQVVSCTDGESGLRELSRRRPAVIVVDLLMPHLDGFNFIARLQRIPDASKIPVVVWTNLDLSKQQMEVLRRDVRQVVYKRDGGIGRLIQELEKELREPLMEMIT